MFRVFNFPIGYGRRALLLRKTATESASSAKRRACPTSPSESSDKFSCEQEEAKIRTKSLAEHVPSAIANPTEMPTSPSQRLDFDEAITASRSSSREEIVQVVRSSRFSTIVQRRNVASGFQLVKH